MTIKKKLILLWQVIPNVFSAHLPILVRCKTKGAVGALCAYTAQSTIKCLVGAVNLKGSHRMGDGRIFLKSTLISF
jgi:hypothetical protein